MISLERVEGEELGEVFLEGLVGQLVWNELDEVHYLSFVCMAQSSGAIVILGEAASKSSDIPYMCIVSPELGELEGYSIYTKPS